jgi:hypothetical protein
MMGMGTFEGVVRKETLLGLTLVFVAARVVFWVGYVLSAYCGLPARTPGFVASVMVNGYMGLVNLFGIFGSLRVII